ncbi:MAG: hypothetical protein IJX76_07800 [Clostridia bacterium]|nr:hypothetical protein [Clostridia bacterium]
MSVQLCCPKCGNEKLVLQTKKRKKLWMCPDCQTIFRDTDDIKKEIKGLKMGVVLNLCFSVVLVIVFELFMVYALEEARLRADQENIVNIMLCMPLIMLMDIPLTLYNSKKIKALNEEIESLENQMTMQSIVKTKNSSNFSV